MNWHWKDIFVFNLTQIRSGSKKGRKGELCLLAITYFLCLVYQTSSLLCQNWTHFEKRYPGPRTTHEVCPFAKSCPARFSFGLLRHRLRCSLLHISVASVRVLNPRPLHVAHLLHPSGFEPTTIDIYAAQAVHPPGDLACPFARTMSHLCCRWLDKFVVRSSWGHDKATYGLAFFMLTPHFSMCHQSAASHLS